MNIAFITTSRADFGIYLPLIKAVDKKSNWTPIILAGGMHVSPKYGNTIDVVLEQGFETLKTENTLGDLSDSMSYSNAFSNTSKAFGSLISNMKTKPDVIFTLGDRFEMLAAVSGVLPFGIKLAHLHGGEDSLGALDQKYRNAISSLTDIHFASTHDHANRIKKIVGESSIVHNVGALGIENLLNTSLTPRREFEKRFGLKTNEPFILTTFHPETIHRKNLEMISEFINALEGIPDRVICTLPNADQQGDVIRQAFLKYEDKRGKKKIQCFENLGMTGYFSAMSYCNMLVGNSSSGIIEAASFNKLVLNVGIRQQGRTTGKNVHHVACNSQEIISKYYELMNLKNEEYSNPYGDGNTSEKIITILSETL